MNERILELAEQAGYDIGPFYTGEDNYQIPHYKDNKLEKFAELLVRECARIVINNGIATAIHDQMVRQDCVNDIKRHFGVEN